MSDIPIFDCVTHPSLTGEWIHPSVSGSNTFERLADQMEAANVPWCFAIAMGREGGFDWQGYPRACAAHPRRLYPISLVSLGSFSSESDLEQHLVQLQQTGYFGIKIHPRLSRIDYQHPLLPAAVRLANRLGMIVLICTYFYSSDPACVKCTPEGLRELLVQIPDEKLILLHAGGVRLLEIAEMTRHFKRVLLDLSFTLCEYANSSLDLDLKYVLRRCHHRICLGSDSPEIPLMRMRERFEDLTDGFSRNVREQIGYTNLFAWTGLPA